MRGSFTRRTALSLTLGVLLASAGPAGAGAVTPVKVGVYEFPPYVEDGDRGVTRGLIDLLNSTQSNYRFELVRTSPQRRYDDLEQGRFDMIAFESVAWGWAGRPVEVSRVFFHDFEVFVAKAGPNVDQSVFDRLEGKSILGRLGFHYAFAGYDADPKRLESRYNTRLTVTHEGNVRSVAAGRADLAIVTRSYLFQLLKADPELSRQVLVSNRTDQVYEHTILLRRGGPVSVEWIDRTLERLDRDGRLAALWARYRIVE